ncbi:hypothetical protein [Variovorax sp. GB1P17]|uniref:hypothetical protein n=1 Tax=Variovorax sp. GB1P17 TaxID=3443740 RepID=UPI003F455353
MFNNTRNVARKFGAKVAVAVMTAPFLMVGHAQAAGGDGIGAALDAVDLSGVATKVGAAALVIVAIALVFKGPSLAKRIISKV